MSLTSNHESGVSRDEPSFPACHIDDEKMEDVILQEEKEESPSGESSSVHSSTTSHLP